MAQPVTDAAVFVPFMGQSLNAYIGGGRGRYFEDKRRAGNCGWVLRQLGEFVGPVELTFTPNVTARRRRDVTNYVASTKILEDVMVDCGVLPDDTNDFVARLVIEAPRRVPRKSEEGFTVQIRALD